MADLDSLAKTINGLQSFEFASFDEARYDLVCDDIEITIDRFSLNFYRHTLSREAYSALSKNLYEVFEKTHTREDAKERKEYTSLLRFFESSGVSRAAKIEKQERPDFVIKHESKDIGVEVTSLSAKEDNQLYSIARKNFGKGLSAEELKEAAYQNYKESSKKFGYYEINGSACIGRSMFNTEDDKREFAETITKKYHKYKREFQNFDIFLVLCDALETIAVTSDHDAEDILNMALAAEPEMQGFVVAIMYGDDAGRVVVYQREL